MKRLHTEDVEGLLAHRRIDQVPDAGAFWPDFRARASLMNQDKPGEKPARAFSRWLAVAAACSILIVVVGSVFIFQSSVSAADDDQMTVDVAAAHSAVLMIKDEPSDSTIVWIVDMSTDDEGASS